MKMLWKIFIIIGLLFIIIGVVMWLLQTYFPHIKKLPGDIFFQHKNITVFIPITTSLLLSLLISIIIFIIHRIIK